MSWFSNLSIGRKLALGFGTLSLLLMVIGYAGLHSVRNMHAELEALQTTHAVPAIRLKESEIQLLTIARAVRNAIIDEDADKITGRQREIARADSAFREEFAAFRSRIVLASSKELASRILSAFDRLRPRQDAVVALAREGRIAVAKAELPIIRALSDSVEAGMDTLTASKLRLMEAKATQARETQASLETFLICAVLVALVLAVGIGVAIARPIAQGLGALSRSAAAMARGDLDAPVTVRGQDEVGRLGASMRQLLEAQRELATAARSLAAGDVSVAVRVRSDRDTVGQAFTSLRVTQQQLVEETSTLVRAATRGELRTRGDAARFEGVFRELVDGINGTMNAMARPIDEASEVLGRIAQRDLRARMSEGYAGDFRTVATSINATALTLDEALTQVRLASEQVAAAGTEIAAGSQSLAQGASEQAASLEEVAASVQELRSSAAQMARMAEGAKAGAMASTREAGIGRERMTELSQAMARIGQSSNETAKIVRAIDEIAFQTNLLALNAAVEAARAGDAGRGFAVVAEEVRGLALRSAEASRSTAALIEQSVQQAHAGVSLNEAVLTQLERIDREAARVAEQVTAISIMGTQQSEGVEQIANAVEQLNSVTQQMAANAEESASASEEQSSQSETMTAMVATFALSTDEKPRVRARPGASTMRDDPTFGVKAYGVAAFGAAAFGVTERAEAEDDALAVF